MRIWRQMTGLLVAAMLLSALTGCEKLSELVPPDVSDCVLRRIDQVPPGWADARGAQCLIVTWDKTMIESSGDRDLDEMGGPELFATIKAAGYGPGCGTTVTVDEDDRQWFASRFGALGEQVWEWHAFMFLLMEDRQTRYCAVFDE